MQRDRAGAAASRASSAARRAAAEAGGDRDPLLDTRGKARTVAVGGALECPANEGVTGEAVDPELGRALDRDAVGERNALVDRDDLVKAVSSSRADDEREVDLRRGRSALHSSASASWRNSGG